MEWIIKTLIAFGFFVLWQLVALFFFFSRKHKSKVTKRGVSLFIACGSLLAITRSGVFWYLDYQLRHHTVNESTHLLQWIVLPEAFLVGQFSTEENIELWLTVIYVALILGSFLWALPMLLFTARKKTTFR